MIQSTGRLLALACLGSLLFGSAHEPAAAAEADSQSKFAKAIDGLKKQSGLWTLYHNDSRLLVDLPKSKLNKDHIVITSIARGISRGSVLGGMTWDPTGDPIWAFKKVGDKIHVVRRNVRFRAKKGSPEADAVRLAYSDSVLYALPIIADSSGGHLVDMSSIFLSDDEQIGREIGPGFRFARDRSTWAAVNAYPKNVELEVAAIYSGGGSLETVPSSRGVQVNVHYSISELPTTNYTPRVADDRVGYFMTVAKDFSVNPDDEHFVRYINRWNLKKKAAGIELSPPEEPITFYVEKTVPVALRPTVRAGILEWNRAFEKIGFDGAIEVRQQRDDDTWAPEDIRYNTFRWITADAGFAMGPSRVNPRTGQILDADIIFDSSFLESWRREYETFTDDTAAGLLPAWDDRRPWSEGFGVLSQQDLITRFGGHASRCCSMCQGMQHQFGFGAAALQGRDLARTEGGLPRQFVHQGLKEVVMHEVGHTLGLRHNFKASAWKSLEDVSTVGSSTEPILASVMDYAPANITADPETQGPYYTQTIGPYDHWAIAYGYTQFPKNKEKAGLAKIASRSGEDGLVFATDEDTRMSGSDPLSNLWDIGSDPLDYAERQMTLSADLMPGVLERSLKEGEGYQRARQAFGLLLSEYFRSGLFVTRYLGGIYETRDHAGKSVDDAPAPLRPVEPAQQRRAMAILRDRIFTPPAIDGEMLNRLPASHWNHWGTGFSTRSDYPIHDTVARMQRRVLFEVLDPSMLTRLQDNAFKLPAGEEAYELPEHFRLLADATYGDILDAAKNAPEQLEVDSFRRRLQRMTVKELANLVTRNLGYPEDARTLARLQLTRIEDAVGVVLGNVIELDDSTRAHLLDTRRRVQQVLSAELDLNSID